MGQKVALPLVLHVSMEPTAVPYAVPPILLNHVFPSNILTIQTPLFPGEWNNALSSVGLLSEYEGVVQGI